MIEIQIRPTYQTRVDAPTLQKVAEFVLESEKVTGSATILITGNREIRDLNRTYRQKDTPTDVLSFQDGTTDPITSEKYLGDIVISYMNAQQHAKEENHSISDELTLLVVHGVLHLLGYDHLTNSDRGVMWDRQEKILTRLGIDCGVLAHLEAVE